MLYPCRFLKSKLPGTASISKYLETSPPSYPRCGAWWKTLPTPCIQLSKGAASLIAKENTLRLIASVLTQIMVEANWSKPNIQRPSSVHKAHAPIAGPLPPGVQGAQWYSHFRKRHSTRRTDLFNTINLILRSP